VIALWNLHFITARPKFEIVAIQINEKVSGFSLDIAEHADSNGGWKYSEKRMRDEG
jgi:hypothetical protein